ncbi:hypothetical protein PN36_14990 [Candidatus Thiomargarita nelsonii]|uniref:ATP-grasp domain-containing protein n=1 Tax=Candidatus Thiomargarita nelsonii TaxID=1003181 RepID=A0A0A6PER8_9GAMM|nr:hypothetical protein PN36_14990 [Candidatus Thiomargarita nelsonii]
MLLGNNNTDEIIMLSMASLGGESVYISNNTRWIKHLYKGKEFLTYSTRLPFDDPRDIDKADNKLFIRSILSKYELPMIPWYLVNRQNCDLLKNENFDRWVIKPIAGMKGISVIADISFDKLQKIIEQNDAYYFVEPFVLGRLYRVLLLNNRILSSYEKKAPVIVGDGSCSVKELLNQLFHKSNIENSFKLFDDNDVKERLSEQNIDFDSILKNGERFEITKVVNISRGATWKGIEASLLNSRITSVCEQISRIINLKLVGVDVIEDENGNIFILEANPSPGLYGHTAKLGFNGNLKSLDLTVSQEILKETMAFLFEDLVFDNPLFIHLMYDNYLNIREVYIK